MDDKKKIALSEAKDLMLDINNGISKTRDKSWQVLAFLIAINVYLMKSIIDGTANSLTISISFICIIFDLIIGWNIRIALFPSQIESNGGFPSKIFETIEQENEPEGIDFYEVLTSNYEDSINANLTLLNKMRLSYDKSMIGLIAMVGCIVIITLGHFLLVKGNECCTSL